MISTFFRTGFAGLGKSEMKTIKSPLITDKKIASELMKTALGEEKADLVIRNANVLNVCTREILNGWSVSIRGKRIAYVGSEPDHTIGENTIVINASGKTVIPGLIDGHTHLAWLYTPSEFLKYAIKGGATTIITETMEPFPVAGYDGVCDFLDSLADQPIKIFATAPAMGSISQKSRGISIRVLKKLMSHPAILGLGEAYWQGVLQNPESVLPVIEETLRSGKTVEGHSAGAKGKKLNAYAALGFSSCHEPITSEEALERLRLGIWSMIREGSIRRDLETISKIKENDIDLRRMILVTDGVTPEDLIEKGYMEFVVQKAIDCGFDPAASIQMATLNVAEHFSIDHVIGQIAPGRYADLLIIPDIKTIRPEYIISNGEIIFKNGNLIKMPRNHFFSEKNINSIHLKKAFTEADFKVGTKEKGDSVKVRVIDQITDLVTQEYETALCVENREIRPDLSRDIIKVAAIDRTNRPGKKFVGFVKGFGMKKGAFASSAAWDTSDIIVVGADDSDMAAAVNRINMLQGGVVVCSDGKIRSELSLPIFGLMSDMPLDALADKVKKINEAAWDLGLSFSDPLLTLITLTGAAIPFLRICEEGLINLKDGRKKDLIIQEKQ